VARRCRFVSEPVSASDIKRYGLRSLSHKSGFALNVGYENVPDRILENKNRLGRSEELEEGMVCFTG
jgi:hypothetical protein